jgi:plastocyanin
MTGRPSLRFAARACLGLAVLMLPISAPVAADDAPSAARVTIKDFMFSPQTLTVHAGATVIWTNQDSEPHSVISDAGLFRSGAMDTGEAFSYRFTQAGTYRFSCSLHPMMVGSIVVE